MHKDVSADCSAPCGTSSLKFGEWMEYEHVQKALEFRSDLLMYVEIATKSLAKIISLYKENPPDLCLITGRLRVIECAFPI